LTRELAGEERVTVICGRYEGMDARLGDLVDIEEVSVGDFVLSGGEAAACCLLEAVGRLLPGFMGHEGSGDEESFAHGLLEYPHYTRPEVVTDERGSELRVPEVLLSGDHRRIAEYRREKALATTWDRRPEMLSSAPLTQQDVESIRKHRAESPKPARGRNLHLVLAHYPVLNKEGQEVAVSLTNLDIHDIGRVSRSYGLGGFYLSTPLEDQRRLAATLLNHWTGGAGAVANPDRSEALSGVGVVESIEDALHRVRERTGRDPLVYVTSARIAPEKRRGGKRKRTEEPETVTIPQVAQALDARPVVLLLGTGSGLAPGVVRAADAVVRPVRPFTDYNHLSVRSATSILVDRILGDTD
jgi:tRNA (guanine37-N1)-methyltransferase